MSSLFIFVFAETLTCFACSGKDCETGRIGTETCSNGDICSYVNIQIFIEGTFFLVVCSLYSLHSPCRLKPNVDMKYL